VTCAQDFTREFDARRHNKNHHFEMAQITNYMEYVIGRARGTIPSPTEYPPRLTAIRKRKRAKNSLAQNKTKSPFTVYPDSTSEDVNPYKDVHYPKVAGTQSNKNDFLEDMIAICSEEVQLRNLRDLRKELAGKTNIPLLPPAHSPENNTNLNAKATGLSSHFSDLHSRTTGNNFLGDILNNFKNIAIIKGLVKDLRYDGPSYNANFQSQPSLSPANSLSNQRLEIDTIMPNRNYIFGFLGIVCDRCLTFEIIPYYFDSPDKDRSVEPTKHTCKKTSYAQVLSMENGNNNQVRQNREEMLLCIDAVSRTWTDDETSIRALQLPSQEDGGKQEVLTIRHPSYPDKLVKVPLKFVNIIDLVIQSDNHWANRAIRGRQTSLQRYELEDFFLRTRTSTYAIFRVKMLYQSGQPIFLGTFFMYVARHCG
jgi:hypothetical protein